MLCGPPGNEKEIFEPIEPCDRDRACIKSEKIHKINVTFEPRQVQKKDCGLFEDSGPGSIGY